MLSVNVREARETIGKLLDAVIQGEEVVIVRRGKAVAKLVQVEQAKGRAKFPDLRAFRAKLPPAKTASAELVRRMRDEERA